MIGFESILYPLSGQRGKRKSRCPCLMMRLADKAGLKGSVISMHSRTRGSKLLSTQLHTWHLAY